MNLRFFGRRIMALLAAALLIAVALTSCSSTGGKPRSTDGGMGAGTADTPHKVVAMIGHYGPGVAFADLIRKGAEAAAAKDNIELRFSTDPDAPTQANMVQSAIGQQGRRHRRHPGQARRHGPCGEGRDRRRHPRRRVQRRLQ